MRIEPEHPSLPPSRALIATRRTGQRSGAETAQTGTAASETQAASKRPGYGRVRHVLLGWRRLTAPVVAQILSAWSPRDHALPALEAVRRYRLAEEAPPRPRLLREI